MNKKPAKIVLSGQRRLFFLTLAVALFLQLGFFALNRAGAALQMVAEDFRVVLIAPQMSLEEAQNYAAKISGRSDVNAATVLDIGDALKNFPGILGVMDGALAPHISLNVSKQVMLKPQRWVEEVILAEEPSLSPVFKEQQADLAAYLNAMVLFIALLLCAAVFALCAWGFFVEAYRAPAPRAERLGAVFVAANAYLLALIITLLLCLPLNLLTVSLKYNVFNLWQIILAGATVFTGWTLAKWKKF